MTKHQLARQPEYQDHGECPSENKTLIVHFQVLYPRWGLEKQKGPHNVRTPCLAAGLHLFWSLHPRAPSCPTAGDPVILSRANYPPPPESVRQLVPAVVAESAAVAATASATTCHTLTIFPRIRGCYRSRPRRVAGAASAVATETAARAAVAPATATSAVKVAVAVEVTITQSGPVKSHKSGRASPVKSSQLTLSAAASAAQLRPKPQPPPQLRK